MREAGPDGPLISVALGGALTTSGGLLGAWIQSAREHHKWLREKRFEVYLPAAAFFTEYELRMQAYAGIESRIDGTRGHATPEEERLEQQKTLEPYAARADEYRDRVAAEMAPSSSSALSPSRLRPSAGRKQHEPPPATRT